MFVIMVITIFNTFGFVNYVQTTPFIKLIIRNATLHVGMKYTLFSVGERVDFVCSLYIIVLCG